MSSNRFGRVESWIEVEGVTNAYAFVAADLLTISSAAPTAVEKVPEANPDDAKVEAAKLEAAKVEAAKLEAAKLEAAKVEAAKAAALKAAVPAPPPALVQEKLAEEPKVAPTVDSAPAAPPRQAGGEAGGQDVTRGGPPGAKADAAARGSAGGQSGRAGSPPGGGSGRDCQELREHSGARLLRTE